MTGDRSLILSAGERVALSADEVVVLRAGEVEVWLDGRLLDIAGAPRWFGLAQALRDEAAPALSLCARSSATLLCRAAAELRASAAKDPAVLAELSAALAADCVRLQSLERAALIARDDFFLPGAELFPPPYAFGPFPCLQLVVEHDPDALAALLPPGLVPFPGGHGRCLVMISDIRGARSLHPRSDGRAWCYREVVPFIPVACPRHMSAGLFTPELYPDATMPVLLGREVYGFPKRLGRIDLGERRARLIVDHALALDLEWQARTPTDGPAALALMSSALVPGAPSSLLAAAGGLLSRAVGSLGLPVSALPARAFVRRRLRDPRTRDERRWELDELVEVPLAFDRITDPTLLVDAKLSLGTSWPLGQGKLIAAVGCEVEFRLDQGRVLRVYEDSRR